MQNEETYILHPDFEKFSNGGGLIFQNIIKLFKNQNIVARTSTDTGFLKMFQAILILQGAKIRVRDELEIEKFTFTKGYLDDKPDNLEVIQNTFADINTDEMVMTLISIAYRKLDAKRKYFQKLLIESVKLGICLVSYGNDYVQNRIMDKFKDHFVSGKNGQYFFFGLRKILKLGKHIYLSKKRDKNIQNLFMFTCLFIQMLCEGHNLAFKNFLRDQEFSTTNVDLITVLGKVGISMCKKILGMVQYIDTDTAPLLMEELNKTYLTNTSRSRSFIDWYATQTTPRFKDLIDFHQVMRTLAEAVQGPCKENQVAMTRSAIPNQMHRLLHFLGAYFWQGRIGLTNYFGDNMEDMMAVVKIASLNSETKHEIPHIFQALKTKRDRNYIKSHGFGTKSHAGINTLLLHRKPNELSKRGVLRKHKYNQRMLQIEGSVLIFLNGLIEGRTTGRDKDASDFDVAVHLANLIDVDSFIANLEGHFLVGRVILVFIFLIF